MATTTVPIDDTGMLSDIMADEPAQAVEQPVEQQAEPERAEQPRDEHGRFAAKTEQEPLPEPPVEPPAAAVTPTPPKEDQEAAIPPWRLRELREERDQYRQEAVSFRQQMAAMERRIAELTAPKQEPVDFFQNPDGAIDQRLTPLRSEFLSGTQKAILNSSKALAIAEHGKDAVKEMEAELGNLQMSNPHQWATLQYQAGNSDHPVGVVMEWFQNHKLVKETGGDIAAYKQRLADELLNDPAFRARAIEAARGQVQPNSRPNIQLPPSLSKVPGSAPERDGGDDDTSDAGLFRHAMR